MIMKYIRLFESEKSLLNYINNIDKKNIKKLISSGADLNVQNRVGLTALIVAVVFNHIRIIKLLINAGADLNIQDYNGDTALIHAADLTSTYPIHGIVVIKLLIDAGIDWNKKNNQGKDFLDYLNDKDEKLIIKLYPNQYKKYLMIKGAEKYNL